MPKHYASSNVLTRQYATMYQSASTGGSTTKQQPQKSVTELIQESRARDLLVSANAQIDFQSTSIVTSGSTYSASVSAYLADPSVETAVPNPARRSFISRAQRRFAGPPPPPTWVAQDYANRNHMSNRAKKESAEAAIMAYMRAQPDYRNKRDQRNILKENLPSAFSTLPSLLPRHNGLMHFCLRSLAENWEFNIVYLQHYLFNLSPSMKMVLIAYIGKYSPNGITLHGLKLLFDYANYIGEDGSDREADSISESHSEDDDELVGLDTDNDRVSSLDISFQLDDAYLSLSDLTKFLYPKSLSTSPQISWQSLSPSHRFPSLTSLSLSHPSTTSPTKLWSALLSLLKSNMSLTALSLAGWPIPPDMFYSAPGSHAQFYPVNSSFTTIRSLSRLSICLKWIDFSYCTWIDEKVLASAEWNSAWRNVSTLVLKDISYEVSKNIEDTVSEVRNGKGWIDIVSS